MPSGAALTVGGLAGAEVLTAPAAAAAAYPLPTSTEPEQLHLTWGPDPSTEVTVSWASPGTVAQPAPTLAYSTQPITAANPGRIVALPAPAPTYYVLGGGGAASTYGFEIDQADGERTAPVTNAPGIEAVEEDAPWSAQIDSGDSHGYAIFDVDAGSKPGETTITVQWFQMATVAPGATPVMPTTPYSKFTYGRTARWKPKDRKEAPAL